MVSWSCIAFLTTHPAKKLVKCIVPFEAWIDMLDLL